MPDLSKFGEFYLETIHRIEKTYAQIKIPLPDEIATAICQKWVIHHDNGLWLYTASLFNEAINIKLGSLTLVCCDNYYLIEVGFSETENSERIVITKEQMLNLISKLMKSIFVCFKTPELLLNNLSESPIKLAAVQIIFVPK